MEKVSKDLVSIVIPIYNVEKYLKKCLDTVLSQTYNNIEIILVDDGSPDSCGIICDEYANKDKRIKVIHKENGGLSDARNAGIDIAKGRYITFIDSDDYVSSDYVEYLFNTLKKYNSKISTCGHYICFDNKMIEKTSLKTKKVSKEEAMTDFLYDYDIDICSWGKLYDISLFESIRFPKGKIFEDSATTYKLFDLCDYIAVGKECKYYYIMRNDSITTKKFNLNKMDLIEMTEEMCTFLTKKYPSLKKACNRRLMWAYMSTYTKIVYTNKSEFKKEKKLIKDYIKNNRPKVLRDKNISKRDKISLIIFPFGDTFFKISWRFYKLIFN